MLNTLFQARDRDARHAQVEERRALGLEAAQKIADLAARLVDHED